MAKLKNLSLNDSIIFKEGSNEGIFNQVTSAKGDSWYNTGLANSLYMMPILTGIIPLRTAMSGLISVKESGTLYTPNAGDTLTTINFTDDNFSDYCSSDHTIEMAIPRRYALSKYNNVSKFPYGILYSFDKSTYCAKAGEIPYYTNFTIPQGVFVVKLDSNGKMLVNTSTTVESVSWEVIFNNPFIIPSEVRNSLNDYTIKTTGDYQLTSENNTIINEFYITHNSGQKELYMFVNTGIDSASYYNYNSAIDRYVFGYYTYSESNFFGTENTPDLDVINAYNPLAFWYSGRSKAWQTSVIAAQSNFMPGITGQIEFFTGAGSRETGRLSFWIHMWQR